MFRYTKLSALREVGFWILGLVYLAPFFVLVTIALKPDSEVFSTSKLALPKAPTLQNFVHVLKATGESDIKVGLANSVFITLGSILVLVLLVPATLLAWVMHVPARLAAVVPTATPPDRPTPAGQR